MNTSKLYLWYHEGTLASRLKTLTKLQLEICKKEIIGILDVQSRRGQTHNNEDRLNFTLKEINAVLEDYK